MKHEIMNQAKVERIISIACTLISKAQEQFDQNILNQLGIYDLFNESYEKYLEYKL